MDITFPMLLVITGWVFELATSILFFFGVRVIKETLLLGESRAKSRFWSAGIPPQAWLDGGAWAGDPPGKPPLLDDGDIIIFSRADTLEKINDKKVNNTVIG